MLALLIFGVVLSAAVDVGQCTGGYRRIEGGWLKPYMRIRTWRDAVAHCQEDGAVLASPFNQELLNGMSKILKERVNPIEFFIGVHALFHPERFVSLEGVPLDDMAGAYLSAPVDPNNGRCMSLGQSGIRTVPCTYRLPFLCYKKDTEDVIMSECGTNDKEYKLLASTGSCYKVHAEKKNWTEAYATCLDERAYLLSPNVDEAFSVSDFVFHRGDLDYVFLGIRQLEVGGPWVKMNLETAATDLFFRTLSTIKMNSDNINVGVLGNTSWGYDYETSVHRFVCERDPSNLKFP